VMSLLVEHIVEIRCEAGLGQPHVKAVRKPMTQQPLGRSASLSPSNRRGRDRHSPGADAQRSAPPRGPQLVGARESLPLGLGFPRRTHAISRAIHWERMHLKNELQWKSGGCWYRCAQGSPRRRRRAEHSQRQRFTSHILPPYMRRSSKVTEVLRSCTYGGCLPVISAPPSSAFG
jgi:hypothetical protein